MGDLKLNLRITEKWHSSLVFLKMIVRYKVKQIVCSNCCVCIIILARLKNSLKRKQRKRVMTSTSLDMDFVRSVNANDSWDLSRKKGNELQDKAVK